MNRLIGRLGNVAAPIRVVAALCATLITSGQAWSQGQMVPASYGAYFQGAPAAYYSPIMPVAHGYGSGYCPCPPGGLGVPHGQYSAPVAEPAPIDGQGDGDSNTDDSAQMPGEDLPEVADLTGDSGYASAPQSAVPNAIGDSFGPCGELFVDNGLNTYHLGVCPGSGRRYKATNNNSAAPQSRFFFNYHYFNNTMNADLNGNIASLDVDRYELGYEYAFFCDLMSVQLNVPLSNTLRSNIVQTGTFTSLPTATEFGDVSLALKAVIYQDCYNTVSVGLGIDIPTADNIVIRDNSTEFYLRNETVVLSPYLAWLSELNCDVFTQGFVQFALPVSDSPVRVNFFPGGTFNGEIKELSQLYVDLSLGAWLRRDPCTGNGIAVISELHYTAALGDSEFIDVVGPGPRTVAFDYVKRDVLNATFGLTARNNNWDGTFAYVIPVTDDRFFEGEIVLQVNKRF